jgi:general secretion pathway protein F
MALPLLGRFHRALQASRFCQALGLALGAGLEAERSLQMALAASGSAVLHARAGVALRRLRAGASLVDAVEPLGMLDGESLQRLSTGERTGTLEPTLSQLGREHTESSLRWLRALVLGIIALLVVVLFLTLIGKVIQLQGAYFREMETLMDSRG